MSTTIRRQYSTGSDSEYRPIRPSSKNPYAPKRTAPYVPHRLGWVKTSKNEFDLARECGVPEEVARDKTLLNLYRDVLDEKTIQLTDLTNVKSLTSVPTVLTDDEIRVLRCYRRSLERYNDSMKKGMKAKPFVHTPPIIYRRARTAGFPHFIATNFHLLERLFLNLPKEDEKRWLDEYKITIQNFREAGGVLLSTATETEDVDHTMAPMNLEQMFSDCESLSTSPASSFDGMLSQMSSDSSDPSYDF